MEITYFIRNNNNSYSEPCDVASIKITKNNKIYYVGARWGWHIPSDVIESKQADVDKLGFHEWIDSLGYTIVEE